MQLIAQEFLFILKINKKLLIQNEALGTIRRLVVTARMCEWLLTFLKASIHPKRQNFEIK